jgi:hypothetical protein
MNGFSITIVHPHRRVVVVDLPIEDVATWEARVRESFPAGTVVEISKTFVVEGADGG